MDSYELAIDDLADKLIGAMNKAVEDAGTAAMAAGAHHADCSIRTYANDARQVLLVKGSPVFEVRIEHDDDADEISVVSRWLERRDR